MRGDSRIVLITGCSSGFGLATSVHLASRGYRVFATMRNLAKSEHLREELGRRSVSVEIAELDVTKGETISAVCSRIESLHGRLDVVVNNAGFGLGGYFADIDDDEYRYQFDTNFFGTIAVTREALPLLLRSKAGRLINISSISGLTAFPGVGPYHSSKWALEGFSESLRMELLPLGIRVCLIEPGTYPTKALRENTRFARRAFNKNGPFAPYSRRMLELYTNRNRNLRGDIDQIASLIERIIRQRRPRFRHVIGEGAKSQYYLRRFLPYHVYEKLVMSYLFGRMK